MNKRITRTTRLSGAEASELLRGIAATWEPVPSDPWVFVRGCFADDVARVAAGAVIPLLWQHAWMEPPIGSVLELGEDESGLRFGAKLGQTNLARSLATTVPEGTTTDVSVDWDILEVSAQNKHHVTRARLREVSLATTGFAADQGAGLGRMGRIGLYDASDLLSLLAQLRTNLSTLAEMLSPEHAKSPYHYGGPEATPATQAALDTEAAELLAFTQQLLAPAPAPAPAERMAPPSAHLARLGLKDAAGALELLSEIRGELDELSALLAGTAPRDDDETGGAPASAPVIDALNVEIADLLAWAKKSLKPTTGGM